MADEQLQSVQQSPVQTPQEQDVPVINPDGNIVNISQSDLSRALNEGYTQASQDDVHKHLMEQKYGGIGQQAITGLEGAAEGVSFGTSTGLERAMGVPSEDILGRKAVNPMTHVAGEIGGLAASALIPVAGEANILRAAGEAGAAAVGLGKTATFIDQVGAHAVKGAFEAGLFQGGEEISKAFAGDPNQTAEHAIADMGLASVMGGVFGGALGAAAKGMKKLTPTFVSELDRPALEAGDFRSSIENSNVLKDHEKTNILEGLAREKSEAKEIKAAANRLGAPVMEGMTSDSYYVQKAEDSLINGVPTYSGIRRKAMYEEGYQKAVGVLDEVLGAEGQYSKAELGNVLKDSIVNQLEEQNAPIKAMYDQLKLSHEVIPLEEKLVGKMAEHLGGIQELRVSPSSVEGQLVKRVMNEIKNLKTVDDVKVYKSTLSTSPTASSGEKRMAGILRDALNDLEEGSIERFAYNSTKGSEAQRGIISLIDQRKVADGQYKEFIGKVRTLAEQLGKGKVYGAQDAINFIREKLTPEEVTGKLFSKKDSEFLKFFGKEFPKEMELMQNYQKAELREIASKTGTFSPKVLFNNINKLEPEVQKSIFRAEELQKVQDAETYIRAFPKNFNPSGTAGMDAFRAFFEHPMGAALANARDYGIEKFIKWASVSPEIQQASDLAKATVRGWNKAGKAIKAVFDPTKEALPSNVIELSGRREKLDKLIAQYRQNPEKLASLGDNNPIPEYATAFAATSSRVIQYLSALKPNEDPQNPLDSKLVPSKAQLGSYNRALDIAQNPLTILKNVKDGSLTVQDIAALKAMYPSMYDSLAQRLQMQMIEAKSKDLVVPYRTRIGMSMFLMTPMDSTLTPQSIMSSQQTMLAQPEPQQQGPAPKRSPAALNKLPQSYQTPAQSRDAHRSSN